MFCASKLPLHLASRTRLLPQTQGLMRYHATPPDMFFEGVSNWLQRIGRKTTLGASTALFTISQNQAKNGYWVNQAQLNDDFRSKHMVLVVHVWMMHRRLLKEKDSKKGLNVQEALFDMLWDDTTNRIHKCGVPEISINKYLKQVQAYSFQTCIELDMALKYADMTLEAVNEKLFKCAEEEAAKAVKEAESKKDTSEAVVATSNQKQPVVPYVSVEEAVIEEISGALYRGLYLRREEVSEELILSVARYLRSEQLRIMELPKDVFYEGRFSFNSLMPFLPSSHGGISSRRK